MTTYLHSLILKQRSVNYEEKNFKRTIRKHQKIQIKMSDSTLITSREKNNHLRINNCNRAIRNDQNIV